MTTAIPEVPTTDPDLEGFTYIRKKKTRSSRTTQKQSVKGNGKKSSVSRYEPDISITIEQIREKYTSRRQILLSSRFLTDFKIQFQELLNNKDFQRPRRLKLLGIGTFSHNPSLTQLAFGLELATLLEIPPDEIRTSDPMYTSTDTKFLKDVLGLTVETVEQGMVHDTNTHTCVFAPHVPKSVYEATLRTYWLPGKLNHLLLLGNNMRHYPDIYSDERLARESPAILSLAQGTILHVVPLPGNFEFNNVFNDLAIQWVADGAEVPEMDFTGHEIETENFEINQDHVEDLAKKLEKLDVAKTQ